MLVRLRPLLAVDSAVVVPTVVIALLRSLRVFRALPVPALEGVAHAAEEIEVASGSAVVRKGEHGDHYYAIADGQVEVVDGTKRLAVLGRGEGFGEIALLHDGIRTATVVAMTDTLLVAIAREPFLVAVTGHGETHATLSEVVEQRLAVQPG
jgi:CRP-like cAMP-binding protein